MAQKPSIPKGTRDFAPLEMSRRNYIFDTIRNSFKKYGYHQIETPAMENLSCLMGKYGEEGDKLLFKILNSGDFMKSVNENDLAERNLNRLTNEMCEKGLRYDLTVPFARFVVQHRQELQLPFKRYQIQPVWRADRPQKGRYREFYQCDADVVGSDSLFNEVELISLIDDVFTHLGINVVIKLNNRKLLAGIAEIIGASDRLIDITVAIDKIDKIGIDNVNAELISKGISEESVNKLQPIILLKGSNEKKLDIMANALKDSEIGMKGVEEMRFIIDTVKDLPLKAKIELDLSLARGLNYYTGTIIEVQTPDVEIGSISGGGRYDNLTGVFGMNGLSGVGISFGADRIYDVMNKLNLYPDEVAGSVQLIFANLGNQEAIQSLKYIGMLRAEDIPCELYPDNAKLKKQFTYADNLNIRYVAVIGETELAENVIMVKDMTDGKQEKLTFEQLLSLMKEQNK